MCECVRCSAIAGSESRTAFRAAVVRHVSCARVHELAVQRLRTATDEPAPAHLTLLRICAQEECALDFDGGTPTLRTVLAADGREFQFRAPEQGSFSSVGATGTGSFLTGLLGVGVGEVVLPQLVRGCCMPLPLAAGTSVATVVITAAAAAVVQFGALAADSGGDIVSVIPWDLVKFTIPGVLVGGQLAPLIASRGILSDRDVERFAAALFATVGIAFAAKVLQG